MHASKKQVKSQHPVRYNNRNVQNQTFMLFSHRPQQSTYQSLRNSQQKVLKLKGSTKNIGIKTILQQKKDVMNGRVVSQDKNNSNTDITHGKKCLSNLNSNQSSNTSLNFYNQNWTNKKEKQCSKINNSLNIHIQGSFLKANKQNVSVAEQAQIVRKKATQKNHKGLQLTKKSYNNASYFMEGYESQNSKSKSARVQKPPHDKYLFLNFNNERNLQQRQGHKQKKITIDLDAYCKKGNNQTSRNISTIDNFQRNRNRNSNGNIYQITKPPQDIRGQRKATTNHLIQTEERKPVDPSIKIESLQVSNPKIERSRQEANSSGNYRSVCSHRGSVVYAGNIDRNENSYQQQIKSHRVNNYVSGRSQQVVQDSHKRIVSILQSRPNSKSIAQKAKISQKSSRYYDLAGQGHKITSKNTQKPKKTIVQFIKYNPNSFSYDHVVGKGGFGKVWKVQCKKTNTIYALKQMSKALVISKKSVPSVMNEQQLLRDLKYPFLVNMVQSFQTRQNLCLLMDFLSGGDLRQHLSIKKHFSQDQAKFIIICILLGLKYLHQNQIIHRDIKPENIVLDEKGYARVTDLGVARKWRQNNSSDTSGTPGYMAPEVLCRQNHSYTADYFAVGVITYELMLRKRPYYGRSRKQIRDQVLAKQVQVKKQQIPDDWSLEGADFINRMIQRKPSNRLGYKGINEIFNHPWLRSFPLQKLQLKKLQSPYIPPKISKNQNDFQNYQSSQDTQIKQLIAQNQIMLRQRQVQSLFSGYQHY